MGVRGLPLKWFRSYLTERSQYTNVNNKESQQMIVNCGVPQGSILGPLLFLIYVNDINKIKLKGQITLFADDTAIFYEEENLDELITNIKDDLETLRLWLTKNLLTLNLSKTVYIVFHKPTRYIEIPDKISINNIEINRLEQTEYLGLILDQNLKWKPHIDFIVGKISPLIGVLYRLRGLMPVSACRNIYHALVQSHLLYMSVIWSNCTKKELNQLCVLQKRAIKNIYGFPSQYPTKDLFVETNILPFEVLMKLQTCIYAFKISRDITHTNMALHRRKDYHSYNTRTKNSYNIENVHTTTYGLLGVKYNILKIYNDLPPKFKTIHTVDRFKKTVRQYLFNLYAHLK